MAKPLRNLIQEGPSTRQGEEAPQAKTIKTISLICLKNTTKVSIVDATGFKKKQYIGDYIFKCIFVITNK